MDKPRLLDAYCGSGGAARGYQESGFYVVGVDIKAQPHYCGDAFVQADALDYIREHGQEYDCIHASPPCQGYSIMHNLPWLKGRKYPLLILPTLELLEASGKPYVLENVMGARYGAKGLRKRGLEAHGLKAGWLCGGMFGLPFYRHRLFATNWFWLAPGHPKHQGIIVKGRNLGDREHMVAYREYTRKSGKVEVVTRTGTTEPGYGLTQWQNPKGLVLRPGYEHVPFSMPTLSNWQNGAQAEGVGIGHAKGWKLAAEAMGIDWEVTRAELTQMIPPVYTRFIGEALLKVVLAPGMRPGVEYEANARGRTRKRF